MKCSACKTEGEPSRRVPLMFLKLRQLWCLDTFAKSLRETCSPGKFYSLHTRSISTMV